MDSFHNMSHQFYHTQQSMHVLPINAPHLLGCIPTILDHIPVFMAHIILSFHSYIATWDGPVYDGCIPMISSVIWYWIHHGNNTTTRYVLTLYNTWWLCPVLIKKRRPRHDARASSVLMLRPRQTFPAFSSPNFDVAFQWILSSIIWHVRYIYIHTYIYVYIYIYTYI